MLGRQRLSGSGKIHRERLATISLVSQRAFLLTPSIFHCARLSFAKRDKNNDNTTGSLGKNYSTVHNYWCCRVDPLSSGMLGQQCEVLPYFK